MYRKGSVFDIRSSYNSPPFLNYLYAEGAGLQLPRCIVKSSSNLGLVEFNFLPPLTDDEKNEGVNGEDCILNRLEDWIRDNESFPASWVCDPTKCYPRDEGPLRGLAESGLNTKAMSYSCRAVHVNTPGFGFQKPGRYLIPYNNEGCIDVCE